ncbi:MAG: hypothetical protein EZS28_035817 [Streblomastix strix]|uniref:Uncharacterized protein n=1 Tax=Streblomastix strix TaxID=222440 RepID=A0A5J4UGK6_9EUKA|nr:MAG: hypothetical protein EZS28_035817 [Streblomastix strix]
MTQTGLGRVGWVGLGWVEFFFKAKFGLLHELHAFSISCRRQICMSDWSQSEDSEEVKDPLSKQRDKEKYTKMDRLNRSGDSAKAKDLLIKQKEGEKHKEKDKQSQSEYSEDVLNNLYKQTIN